MTQFSKLPRVICLGHQACVGKGTIATYLQAEHGYNVLHFAARLREVAASVTGLAPDRFTIHKREPNPEWDNKTGAQILQDIGKALRDAVHVDVWARVVAGFIARSAKEARFVVEDLRYPSEVAVIRAAEPNAEFWKITRPDELRGDIGRPKTHESEIALASFDEWDAVIPNEGTIEELLALVDAVLAEAR